jgi:hypothetical protein
MRANFLALVVAASACGSEEPGTCNAEAPYVACGCGCCPDISATVQCLGAGENLCDVIAQDLARAASPTCATTGCAAGVEYRVCTGQ